MISVKVDTSHAYEVKIGAGLLDSLGDELSKLASGKVLVVTDETVAPLYLDRARESLEKAGFAVFSTVFPAGEATKCVENYVKLLEKLTDCGLSRSDTVVALGGGVVGDLSGFAAATYLRGIRFVQVPTTLLAMVDSSVGGKTAVNLPRGKNLVGAFHQPSLVLCDPTLLDTLPLDMFRCGCGEVIKTAILFDADLFRHLCERGLDFDRAAVIRRCVECKRDIVRADEFDLGRRQLLNLGHTVGHALEKLTNFDLLHGQAVSVGCAVFARAFAEKPEEIVGIFEKFGLPTHTTFSAEMLADAALSDKKRQGQTITLVVPLGVGRCELRTVPVSDLANILRTGL